jgi:hypothetical protein
MIAMVWLDRERRYFISTASSGAEGIPYTRTRWRQLDSGPARVEVVVPLPEVAELYYSCCAKIDQHNRCRQAHLEMEKRFQVKEWSFRVNSSLLAMIVVDSWMVYRGAVGDGHGLSQNYFYVQLATELLENSWNGSSIRERTSQREMGEVGADRPRSGLSAHLTPIQRKWKNRAGETLPFTLFGNCCECMRKKSRYLCSVCYDDDGFMCRVFLGKSSTGRSCYEKHVQHTHLDLSQ